MWLSFYGKLFSLISSPLSLKLVLTDSTSLFRDERSLLSTWVMARHVVVFLRQTLPILRHKAGRNITISMGSTSLAITTSWAFFFSTRVVTSLTPRRTTGALLVGASSLPSALAAARSLKRSFLACLVSGLYLSRSLNSWVAVCLSRVL